MPQPIPEQEHEAVEPVGVEAVLPLQEARGRPPASFEPASIPVSIQASSSIGKLRRRKRALHQGTSRGFSANQALRSSGAAGRAIRTSRSPAASSTGLGAPR